MFIRNRNNKKSLNCIYNILLILILFSILLIPAASAANPQIKLTTNRYIILDDPNKNYVSVTASSDTGFGLPGSWNTDTWKGESTTIRGVALVLNANGTPASGVTVTFAVLDWNDANPRSLKSDTNSKTNVTNGYGLATVPFNLNNEQQYGNWKITATATVAGTSVSSTSKFVYNWWGCQNCHGSPYSNQGDSEGYESEGSTNKYDPYSPYITGKDFHATMYRSDHVAGSQSDELQEGECWACHNSYDKDLNLGQERPDNGATYAGKGTPSTYGVHTNLKCAECHSIIGTSSSGVDQTVKSCDATGCHRVGSANNSNSHIGQETVTATSPNKYVNYSGLDMNIGVRIFSGNFPTPATFNSNPLTGARAHTSATVQNIPCTVCHGPMHNVTKPDISTVPKNPVTEDTQCTTCHQSLKHSSNNPVYCTACHSQDAHTIKVLGTDGTYKDRGSAGAITSGVSDCVTCHNSGSADNFLGNLTVQDSQAYAKNYDPAGKYLNQHPSADCTNSCHDTSNFHNISSVGGGSNCLSCHNSTGTANHKVDGNAIATGIHANLNPKDPVNPNSKCWGCHQSDGNEPQNSMGDIFDTPYKCVDCHLSTGVKSGGYGAFIVNEHYPSGNDIKVLQGNNLSACIQCHNKSEMKVNYISPDNLFTNYSLVSHYGKNRNDMHNLNETDCSYCHESSSEFNNIFLDINNTQITHNNGQSCITCHRESGATSGRIHDSSLLGGGGSDCRSCHDVGKNNVIRHIDFNAAGQGIHSQMNNNIDPVNGQCWGCHQTGGTSPTGMGDRAYDPYICTDCHLSSGVVSGIYNAPIVSEHYRNGSDILAAAGEITDVLSCVKCHQKNEMVLTNSDNDPGTYDSDGNGIYGGSTNPYIYGKKRTDMYSSNETNCSYCHQNTSEFNNIFNKLSNTQITHNNGKSCYICHREKGQINGRIHDSPLLGGGAGACLQCHSTGGGAPVVDSTDLGSHINLNITVGGTGNLTNEDCNACHFSDPHAGPNLTNTYYCYDCHNKSAGGRAPIRSSKKFDDKKHGEVTCINCHAADGRYHQGNPRGSVANSTYISRYPTTNTNTTDCADCHRAANLDDAPFYAPGGGSHIGQSCTGGGCHGPSGAVVQVVHNVNPLDSLSKKPNISTPALDYSTVPQGTEVNVTVTVNFTASYGNALVDGAQYRIMSDLTEISPWTPMIASDGNFDSIRENASGRINTNNLSGTYNIEVRGMGGGPSQNPLERYYPMNGDISLVKTAILTVQPQGGFINGRITSDGNDLEGVLVTTIGASDITGSDGTYSLSVPAGTYNVTASKLPEYNDNTAFNIEVSTETTSYANMSLSLKSVGTISGTVVIG